jgi:hypothetical protein
VSAPPALDRGSIRLALLLGGLVLALIAGFGLGRLDTGTATPAADGRSAGDPAADHTHAPGAGPHDHSTGGTTGAGAEAGGLSLSAAGYTLAPGPTSFGVGKSQDFRFQVRGADRKPVTSFAVVHDKPMHLIVVRRDLSGYQHLHPTMASDGTWSMPLTLPAAGIWRAYADFTALDGAGRQTAITLGVDLVAAGGYAPRPLPAAAREAAVDGFTVAYEGTPQVGATRPLQFRVFRDGSPVAGPSPQTGPPDPGLRSAAPAGGTLEPYLGAYGHLVAVRDGDLAYLHAHPEDQLAGGAVKFWLAAPSPGRYRLFFDFQVAGAVRTAEFTLTVA